MHINYFRRHINYFRDAYIVETKHHSTTNDMYIRKVRKLKKYKNEKSKKSGIRKTEIWNLKIRNPEVSENDLYQLVAIF